MSQPSPVPEEPQSRQGLQSCVRKHHDFAACRSRESGPQSDHRREQSYRRERELSRRVSPDVHGRTQFPSDHLRQVSSRPDIPRPVGTREQVLPVVSVHVREVNQNRAPPVHPLPGNEDQESRVGAESSRLNPEDIRRPRSHSPSGQGSSKEQDAGQVEALDPTTGCHRSPGGRRSVDQSGRHGVNGPRSGLFRCGLPSEPHAHDGVQLAGSH